jgi:hypothetical protein
MVSQFRAVLKIQHQKITKKSPIKSQRACGAQSPVMVNSEMLLKQQKFRTMQKMWGAITCGGEC